MFGCTMSDDIGRRRTMSYSVRMGLYALLLYTHCRVELRIANSSIHRDMMTIQYNIKTYNAPYVTKMLFVGAGMTRD